MIIIVTLLIVIDINEQKLSIPVGYSINHDKKYRLLNGRAYFELYFLKRNKCMTVSNWVQTINVRNLSTKFY